MLSDSRWDEVKPYFDSKHRKRKQSLQVIVSAVIYLLRTGCQWRMLPEGEVYGKWELVYYYYRKWMAYAVLEDTAV
jgi:transposase